ncbi:MAG TPA: hypothetical protein VGG75_14840 [Trebonia sp.]
MRHLFRCAIARIQSHTCSNPLCGYTSESGGACTQCGWPMS